MAISAGPAIALIMFYFLGDEWEPKECQEVIYVGLALGFMASFLCFLFNDSQANESSKVTESNMQRPLLSEEEDGEGHEVDGEKDKASSRESFWRRHYIPTIISTADIALGLVSGMSVKFFPLFFANGTSYRLDLPLLLSI